MKKTIKFGKFAVANPKRRTNAIEVTIEYRQNDKGHMCFSAMGSIWNNPHTDIIMGGQCLDEIHAIMPHNKKFAVIHGLWERNHLNDMDACANDAQRKAVAEYRKENRYDYDKVCDYLKEKGLFEVDVNGKKCEYGHEWYYREISEQDRELIESLFND